MSRFPPAGRMALILLLAAATALAWLGPLDRYAAEQAENGLKRALISFATARALNAVISVLAGTEVSGGVVVGVKLAPGQVLDPVNDLIEQFSNLMLAASIAFGAQLLLMKMGASWVMSALLTLAVLAWSVPYWRGRTPPGWLTRVLVALLLVRFILPVAALGSDLAYHAFMAGEYQTSQQGIERSAASLGALGNLDSKDKTRWWDVAGKLEELKQAAEDVVEHSIRLAVVFLLQTLVLPLLVMWVLLRASRLLWLPRQTSPT